LRSIARLSAALTLLSIRMMALWIAQRLSTVKSADRIIVVAGGEVVKSGTYEELCAATGRFADFARRQLL